MAAFIDALAEPRVAAVLRDLGRDARRVVDRVYPEPAAAGEGQQVDRWRLDGPVRTVACHGKPGWSRVWM